MFCFGNELIASSIFLTLTFNQHDRSAGELLVECGWLGCLSSLCTNSGFQINRHALCVGHCPINYLLKYVLVEMSKVHQVLTVMVTDYTKQTFPSSTSHLSHVGYLKQHESTFLPECCRFKYNGKNKFYFENTCMSGLREQLHGHSPWFKVIHFSWFKVTHYPWFKVTHYSWFLVTQSLQFQVTPHVFFIFGCFSNFKL